MTMEFFKNLNFNQNSRTLIKKLKHFDQNTGENEKLEGF